MMTAVSRTIFIKYNKPVLHAPPPPASSGGMELMSRFGRPSSKVNVYSSPISSFQTSGFAWMNWVMRSLHSVESRLTISTPREMRKSSPPAYEGERDVNCKVEDQTVNASTMGLTDEGRVFAYHNAPDAK